MYHIAGYNWRQRLGYVAAAIAGGSYAYYKHDQGKIQSLSSGFPDLRDNNTAMGQALTTKMYSSLCEKYTPSGFTLDKCIQHGVDNPGDGTGALQSGVAAGDAQCYTTFQALFDPVIAACNPSFTAKPQAPEIPEELAIPAFPTKYVKGVTMEAHRNLAEYPFAPAITRGQRRQVEHFMKTVFDRVSGDIQGTYKPLIDTKGDEWAELVDGGLAFNAPAATRPMEYRRDWPSARGILLSKSKDLAVWVNNESHATVRSVGKDFSQVYQKFSTCIAKIDAAIVELGGRVMWTERLGYMGPDVTRLGNSCTVEAEVRLPVLGEDPSIFSRFKSLGVQCIGYDEREGTWKIAIQPQFNISAGQQVSKMANSIQRLIAMEEAAATGKS